MCSPWGLVELRLVSQAFFTFFRGVYFLLTGNKKASDLKGGQSFLSFVNVCCLIFSLLFNAFKIEDGSPSRTIKSWLFQGLYISPQHIHYSMKSSHIFGKLGCLVEIKFRDCARSAFPPTQVPRFRLTLFTVRIIKSIPTTSNWLSEWLSECQTFSVAQHRLLARVAGVRYHDRTTSRGFKSNCEISAAFVTTRANG